MHPKIDDTRRHFMFFAAAAGTGLLVPGHGAGIPQKKQEEKTETEVTAVEDLMREHGVLRRALLVYAETAPKLRLDASAVDPETLQKTAVLFRAFGEDYHEKKLEEAHIFPAIRKAGGPAAIYPDVLAAQHSRGREITDYILAITKNARIGAAHTAPLATAMESFVLMYQNHAAREDTIVFPAWKLTMSPRQLDEMGDLFEEIEKQQFGTDGYEHAVQQIGDIEGRLGLADLARFTAPPPPKI